MSQEETQRLGIVLFFLVVASVIVMVRLFDFQVINAESWKERQITQVQVQDIPDRGLILDKHHNVLAGNGADYSIGASPSLIYNKREVAAALAPILQINSYDLLAQLESTSSFDTQYVRLKYRATEDEAEAIRAFNFYGIQIDPEPRRIYPQGDMLCHVLGISNYDNVGINGLEEFYNGDLAGQEASIAASISPLEVQPYALATEGRDLVLTIDRTVQHLVERKLAEAVNFYGAEGGNVIVMDPRTGALIATANYPCYDPFNYFEEEDERIFTNSAVSIHYEPGSVMKLITMAAALDSGTVVPASTYYDAGIFEVGGSRIYNAGRGSYGTVDMKYVIAYSLNVGAATLAFNVGPDGFYNYMKKFRFGEPSGIDLSNEAQGVIHFPGDAIWTEVTLAANSYGQGMTTTPIQMVSAVSAIANNGYQMRPYIVEQVLQGDEVIYQHEAEPVSRPITPETARQVTDMARFAVDVQIDQAQVPGYSVAGKTGTAEIPEEGGVYGDETIASFIGWLPADDPEIVVLYKLDRPSRSIWGSETAAPAFSDLAKDLVVLLDIPPDAVRQQLMFNN
ncbi:MAG: penicillin-binding protein 2 [Chloroflexota bacterium]